MLMFGSGVAVGGATTCPDPAAVQSLLPRGTGRIQGTPDRAKLSRVGARLKVELLDSHDGVLAERELDTSSSCAGLAQAAAVVISALELEVWAVPGVDEVPLPPREAGASPVASPGVVAGTNSSPRARPSLSLEPGAAGLVSADSGGRSTWVLGLTLALAPSKSALRPEVGLFGVGSRDMLVDDGKVSYQRFWLSLGLGYELKWGRWAIEPQGELLGALLVLRGDGVTSVATDMAANVGAQAGLTGQWSFGSGALWAGLFGLWWPDGTQVQIGRPGQSRALPPVEFLLGGGIRFRGG